MKTETLEAAQTIKLQIAVVEQSLDKLNQADSISFLNGTKQVFEVRKMEGKTLVGGVFFTEDLMEIVDEFKSNIKSLLNLELQNLNKALESL